MDLQDIHIEDLQRSGLSDSTIEVMGCRSVSGPIPGVESAIEFPYYGIPGYSRFKLFPALDNRKYHQQMGTGNHFYLLPPVVEILADVRHKVWFVEGEKKSARGVQEGLNAIGFGGIWNWKETDDWCGTEELHLIPLAGREVEIVPDSDVWIRDDLLRAIYAFAKFLDLRGANVSIAQIPQSKIDERLGLDDYLCRHNIDEFHSLKRFTLKDKALAYHRTWYEAWRKKKDEELRQQPQTFGDAATDEEIEATAGPVIESLNILDVYRKEIRRLGYGGDLTPVLIVLLAVTTRILKLRRGSIPAHLGIVGPPSIGKSFTNQTVLSLLPPEAFHVIDAGSPRALIYSDASLKHRVLCFAESDSLPAGEDNPAASAIRNLCQDHYLHYEVVVRDGESGKFTTQVIEKEGPTVLVTTAVRFLGGQLGTRLFLVEIPEDVKRLQAAIQRQAQSELLPPSDPSAALIAFQSVLQRKAPFDVVVPFAPELGDEIAKSASAPRILRDFQRLLSLIKAVAALHYKHRNLRADGRLEATVNDYAAVHELVNEMYTATVSEVTKSVRAVVEKVRELEKEESPVTYSVIAKSLGIHPQQAKRTANRAVRQDWLINKQEKKNRPADLTTDGAAPMPETGGLPDPLTLRGQCETVKCPAETESQSDENVEILDRSAPSTADITPSHSEDQDVKCEGAVTDNEAPEKIDEIGKRARDRADVSHFHTQPRKKDGGNNGNGFDPNYQFPGESNDEFWTRIRADDAARSRRDT
jgi:hypothetical protein